MATDERGRGGFTGESPPALPPPQGASFGKQPPEPVGDLTQPVVGHAPPCTPVAATGTSANRRDAEKALRALGLSARQAKRVIAAGWTAAFKDEQDGTTAEEVVETIRKTIAGLYE
jgi:hypothetical protein